MCETGLPGCTTLTLFCFPGNYRNCLMENLQVFSALEDDTISNSFSLERVTVHSVEEELSHGLPNHDCGENHHRCQRFRMTIADRREKFGSSTAELQPLSFPLTSGSEPNPRSCQRIWVLQVQNNTRTIQDQWDRSFSNSDHRERTSSQHRPHPALLFLPRWLQRPTYILTQKKKKKRKRWGKIIL